MIVDCRLIDGHSIVQHGEERAVDDSNELATVSTLSFERSLESHLADFFSRPQDWMEIVTNGDTDVTWADMFWQRSSLVATEAIRVVVLIVFFLLRWCSFHHSSSSSKLHQLSVHLFRALSPY
jgi:hypothetical protein